MPADNTTQNQNDRGAVTPIDQGETKQALRITADIRKALTNDSSLSTNAHNCKVIADDSGALLVRRRR